MVLRGILQYVCLVVDFREDPPVKVPVVGMPDLLAWLRHDLGARPEVRSRNPKVVIRGC